MKKLRNAFIIVIAATGLSTGSAQAFSEVPFPTGSLGPTTSLSPFEQTAPEDLLLIEADGPDLWVVSGLSSGDTLNIRSGPGVINNVVARAPNGVTLRNLGCQGVGSSRWCKVETRDGRVRGWVNGAYLREAGGSSAAPSSAAPVIARRSTGEIEVRWNSGCTMLYNSRGNRIQAGGSCSGAQRSRSDDAVARYLREAGGTSQVPTGGRMHKSGNGSLGNGSPVFGQINSRSGETYIVTLTATQVSFTCTGFMDRLPNVGSSRTTSVRCSNGNTGTATVSGRPNGRYRITFTAGNRRGQVTVH